MKKLTTYIIVIIIVISAVGGVLAAREFYFKDSDAGKKQVAEEGDKVTVHYVGWVEDDRIYERGRIFDCSKEIQNVSKDIPARKTIVTFSDRDRGEPFQFTVGKNVIEGWSENVKGMKEGQTKTFTVPPNKGYSARSEDLIMEVNKTETIPMHYEMTVQTFETKYGMSPSPHLTVEHEFWNWTTRVNSVEGETVNMVHEPVKGEVYRTYKQDIPTWRSKVLSIDSDADGGKGEIVVEHQTGERTVVDASHLSKHDVKFRDVAQIKRNIGQNPQDLAGVVVDTGEKITIDFNPEVNGKTLHFRMTVLDIQKA